MGGERRATPTRGGSFAAADACDALLERARRTVATLLGGQPAGIVFGANMTTLTLAFSRAVAATLRPGDRVVGTRLDHDANVTPWRLACDQAGAEQVLAPFDPATGLLDPADVIALIDERTRWVTLPGASNLIGTVPDLAPIVAAAHDAGARVFVDAVHLAPHKPIDVAALGCDVLACSPYKWYGPHAGVLCADPALLDELPNAKVRPAADRGPRKWESGTPSFESIAAVDAAAQFLLDTGMDVAGAVRGEACSPRCSRAAGDARRARPRAGRRSTIARRPSPSRSTARAPTRSPTALAAERIATWAGHSYAVEVVGQLGLADDAAASCAPASRSTSTTTTCSACCSRRPPRR